MGDVTASSWLSRDVWDALPRTAAGHPVLRCAFYRGSAHGSHQWFRGDQRIVCPGIPRGGTE